jgi:hypothetical protein
LGRFHQLSPEQLDFLETFIRCEGKISWVQQEMELSYPAVRSRLNDVIRSLGYEVKDEAPRVAASERRAILSELAEGNITSEEAIRLLRAGRER